MVRFDLHRCIWWKMRHGSVTGERSHLLSLDHTKQHIPGDFWYSISRWTILTVSYDLSEDWNSTIRSFGQWRPLQLGHICQISVNYWKFWIMLNRKPSWLLKFNRILWKPCRSSLRKSLIWNELRRWSLGRKHRRIFQQRRNRGGKSYPREDCHTLLIDQCNLNTLRAPRL